MADAELLPELIVAAKLAADAGGAALLDWQGRFSAREKGPSDFVTDADLASQRAIQAVLSDRRPSDAFIGEEQHEGFKKPDDEQVCWVVDPLDGTTNYVHGFPCFAVSVAATLAGEPIVGVVYDPRNKERFWAAKGHGAWLGEQRVHTSSNDRLQDSLVAMSLPAQVHPESPDLADMVAVVDRCRAVRRIGSAALNLAYVACGRLDLHWAREISAWDVAAGALLVREAGGVVTNPTGEKFDLWEASILAAANEPLQAEMAALLSRR